ncbi:MULTISPECIES: adenosylcobinamide-GDP ribazoletransferase [Halopseudomonas]|uniref:Adenosylcobinamide-GDP ribazoletransferase n=1 Tax=Halopseudomonas bauzanensis TaxID=653930 RepID=A0A4U0YEH5_9GAMM|nr:MULTISPECIES: adenosylcobinamide-GDP ribazoletransferase [Halopseudomonas]EZQ17319.1 cobalamin synthase [Halopseudomonas bauzanensis]TKA90230.1 adenosylcobinamide-GDP ribazoletransferase [Halopseudomonas bauzanensis]WGK62959.1 adenosylcobinamide-GDP ribazoletransferase [Halopseudomonas sp. SMJS2]
MPLLIALQFLTRLPVRLPRMPTAEESGRSLLWYPWVGLLIGAVLLLGHGLLNGVSTGLQAALLLTLWVWLSGGLHLDGLADTADAWVGGYGDRERTLAIMKDPTCGPIGVISLVLVLLLKLTALVALLEDGHWGVLLLAPWLGRWILPLLLFSTPYARAGGLGDVLARHMPRQSLPLMLGVHALAMLLFGWPGLLALAVALLVLLVVRHYLCERLGGTTGDTAGALVELVETAVLVSCAVL